MKQQLRALAAATLLTVTLGSPNAFADLNDDGKRYSGSMCQPNLPLDLQRMVYSLGTVHSTLRVGTNPTWNDGLFLECPIVRDKGGRLVSGFVAVVDARTDDAVTCFFRSMNAPDEGGIVNVHLRRVNTSNAYGDIIVQHLWFSDLRGPANGYYSLDCRVPPATLSDVPSKIVFYGIIED